LVLPIFVQEERESTDIQHLPGHRRLSISDAISYASDCLLLGIKAFALFPVILPGNKDTNGSQALNSDSIIYRALRAFRSHLPEALLIADVALDPYTTHGHDGIWSSRLNDVDNDATVAILEKMAILLAQSGAHLVAPSDMMDGRIRAIRAALDRSGHTYTGIISYAAKYASCYYGPFRQAIGAASAGAKIIDKRTYQLNPANSREAILECLQDEAEGADILMIKPAGNYLDIIKEVKSRTPLPVAAYQVSGEYAAICAAAEKGWLDKNQAALESLISIRRAGADFIFTYFAKDVASLLRA
jgi:porphobilinogen synthase